VEKRGGGSALNIFSILYTHHRIPNEHMMTINFDTITNNYEVIYVIKTVMKYYFFKIDTSCCFVEIKKYLVEPFLIVYLHLQWNAVLTQIMLCLAEAALRNSRFFCVNPY
jgi:hypothetical protein